MKTLTVDVTASDIADGRPRSPNSCPIARALARTGLRGDGASLAVQRHGVLSFEILEGEVRTLAYPSVAAQEFIEAFDDGGAAWSDKAIVRPLRFRFQLTPRGVQRMEEGIDGR